MSTQLQAPGPESTPKAPAAPVSSNGGLPDDESSVRDVMRGWLADESEAHSPADIADALLGELTPDQLYAAARIGLRELAKDLSRLMRNHKAERFTGSSRWDDVADAEKEHKDVLLHKVCVVQGNQHVNSVMKFLGDCTSADLAAAESIKREVAAGALASVKAYKRLRDELKSPRQTVKSLGQARVREILYA